MKNRRAHKFISMILTVALLCTLLAPYASAAGTTYSGRALAAVSTDISTDERSNSWFEDVNDTESDTKAMEMLFAGSDHMDGITGIRIDPETGETLYIKDKALPEVEEELGSEPAEQEHGPLKAVQQQQYSIGSEKVVYEDNNQPHTMVCCYIGEHCTVWGCKSDGEQYNSKLMLTAAQAETIGKKYDGYYQDIVTAYGNWYDADGDGKLAIFCFDIDQNYAKTTGNQFSGSYTAGYFWSIMLADSSGSVNGGKVKYSSTSQYKDCYISTDSICIDTFPSMGSYKSNPLSNVAGDPSTLVHENQHLINFSYRALSATKIYSEVEDFMNEAFSMAAEHMICGESSTSDRVNYFNNSSDYVKGTPLTYWGNSLSNYANSYLFGQYLRTRYSALKNDPEDPKGNTFYKTLLQQWQSGEGSTSAIDIAASIFGTTPEQLVIDFWAAIYLKNPTGWYGFQGESWADRINPLMSSRSQRGSIGNGGVRYYDLSKGSMSVSSKTNVTMIRFNNDGSVTMDGVPVLRNVSVQRTAVDRAKLTFTPTLSGTLKYTLSESATVDPHELTESASFTANRSTTIEIDLSGWKGECPTISFLARSGDFMCEIQSKKVPSFYDNELNYGGFFCGCKEDQFTVIGTFSSGEKLCVVSYDANGQMLGCHMMTAAGTVSLPEDTDHIKLMSLDSAYLPKIARGDMDLSE